MTPVDTPPRNGLLGAEPAPPQYLLSCACCAWTSASIGIKFAKNTSIFHQLHKHLSPASLKADKVGESGLGSDVGTSRSNAPQRSGLSIVDEESERFRDSVGEADKSLEDTDSPQAPASPQARFKSLATFYQSQMSTSDPSSGSGSRSFSDSYAYASPNALNRIMNIYTSYSSPSTTQKRTALPREACSAEEGLFLSPSATNELATIQKLQEGGYKGTASASQKEYQHGLGQGRTDARFISDLLPVPYLLRTKRTKRCRSCKHIVVRPEAKVQTSRFRMKMVAASYIPTLSIKNLPPSASSSQISSSQLALPTQGNSISPGGPNGSGTAVGGNLIPNRTAQFLLTVKNPLYERIKITLATPPTVPGKHPHRITLLCPSFEVGASREAYADVWADALADPAASGKDKSAGGKDGRKLEGGSGESVAEAGKVFERGRNSVGVVVEVVPASLRTKEEDDDIFLDAKSQAGKSEAGMSDAGRRSYAFGEDGDEEEDEEGGLGEDEDVLEIPVRVRVEWEMEIGDVEGSSALSREEGGSGLSGGKAASGEGEKVRRELSYWVVFGVGRVNRAA